MDATLVGEVIGAAITAAVGIGGWAITRPQRRREAERARLEEEARREHDRLIRDEILGHEAGPGYPAKPGLSARLAIVETRTEQLEPNHGQSLVDRVAEMQGALTNLSDQLVQHLDDDRQSFERIWRAIGVEEGRR